MSIVRLTIYMPIKHCLSCLAVWDQTVIITIKEGIYKISCNNRTNFRVIESTIGWEALTLEFIFSFTRILSYIHTMIWKFARYYHYWKKTVETVPTGLWGFNTFWFLNLKNCKLKSCIFNGYWFCSFSLVFRKSISSSSPSLCPSWRMHMPKGWWQNSGLT